jgi:nucleotide-binding universal stress UspA family protein
MVPKVAITRIAVGVDGSDGSDHALTWAAELAESVGAEILAVHVVPQSWLVELEAFQVKTDQLVAERRAKLLGEWTDGLRKQGVAYSAEFGSGNPAAELLRIAREHHADVIVVGGSPHHGIRRDAIGHTAHRVANLSPLPVVVVPLPDDGTEEWVPIPG